MALLLREAIGDSLRRARVSQRRTLREVSSSARVSLGYLSEVERGRKEASSELLAAICGALDVPISDVLSEVSESMAALPAPDAERTVPESAPAASATASVGSSTGSVPAARIDEEMRIVIPAPVLVAA